MFEEYTQEYLLEKMLEEGENLGVTVTEGSLVYNAACLMAVMLEDAFDKAEEVYVNAFADTCDREHLIRIAGNKGLMPFAATKARYRAICNTAVPVGSVLLSSNMSFTVFSCNENEDEYELIIDSEMTGTVANSASGTLYTEMYIEDFESCEIAELLVAARDDESTDEFRKRYFDTFPMPGQFGNIKAYLEHIKAIEGVGAVRVGVSSSLPRKVQIRLLGTDGKSASDELVSRVRDNTDVAVGQELDVEAAERYTFQFTVNVAKSASASVEDAQSTVNAVIDEYIKKMNLTHFESGDIRIRLPYLEMLINELETVESCEVESVLNHGYTVEIPQGKFAQGGVDLVII